MNAIVQHDPVALVGIGCRFPGGVNSPSELWDLLISGSNNMTGARPDRFPNAAPNASPATTVANHTAGSGAFFEADVLEYFDNEFFGISPREAERTDPQQRLLLETAWEALEDAGITLHSIDGGNGGVFIGQWTNDFESLALAHDDEIDLYSATGSGRYATSGRLSFKLGMRGPSLTIDTACSSGSVALHLANAAIRNGECDMALVGGVNVILRSELSVAFDRAGMVSNDKALKFGDAGANGFVRSEGAVVLVLKSMESAVADRDRIYATICGSAVTSDGRTGKYLTSPGIDGHKQVLIDAWARSDIAPADLSYVEAHGTGTASGDRVELNALGQALALGDGIDRPCPVGSVKTNVGHLEGASGLAGLIKAALVIKNRTIPPTLNFETPNTEVDWSNIRVVTKAEDLRTIDGMAAVGVTCFGLTGTNVHTVLSTPPEPADRAARPDPLKTHRRHIIPLSARHPRALAQFASALHDELSARPQALGDVAFSAANRRTAHHHRAAILAQDIEELQVGLAALADNTSADNLLTGRAVPGDIRQVWVAGPTAEWDQDEFRALIRSVPEASDALAVASSAFAAHGVQIVTGPDGMLVEELDGDTRSFVQQFIWASVLCSYGLGPNTVLAAGTSHSLGLFLTGAVDLETAVSMLVAGAAPIASTDSAGDHDRSLRTCEPPDLPAIIAGFEQQGFHAVLLGPGDPAATVVDTSARAGSLDEAMLGQVAQLFAVGAAITWPADGNYVDLPRYRWQRRRAWPDEIGATVRSFRAAPHTGSSRGVGAKLAMLAHRPDDHVWQGGHAPKVVDEWLRSPDVLARLIQTTVGQDLGPGAWECRDVTARTMLSELAGPVTMQLAVLGSATPTFELSIRSAEEPWQQLAHGGIERRIGYPLPAPFTGLLDNISAGRRGSWIRERVGEQIAVSIGQKPSARIDPTCSLSSLRPPADFESQLRERLQALAGIELPVDMTAPSQTINQIANRIAELLASAPADGATDRQRSSADKSTEDLAQALAEMLNEPGTQHDT